MNNMEKTRSEELTMMFRQLSSINQQHFLMMVHVADVAEKNVRKKSWAQTEPGQGQ